MTIRVIFIVTSFWSLGELLIAQQFAQSIQEQGDEVLFIIPPTHKEKLEATEIKHICLVPKSRKLNRIIFNEVNDKFKPNLVILSDFLNYNFADTHYGLFREDLELFKCKLATFDNFDWNVRRKHMDTYGFISDIPRKVNIEDYGARIIPCPIANPLIKNDGEEYRYYIVKDRTQFSDKERDQLREKHQINVNTNKKVILVSAAKWQKTHAKHVNIDSFIELSNHIFNDLLIRLAKEHLIILIGSTESKFLDIENIIQLESMPTKDFEEYIAISDLYIGKNITSTSMIKIAFSGVPCVNIINSFTTTDNLPNKEDGFDYKMKLKKIHAYKYMMYPVGWYDFLSPVIKDNLYGEIIQFCEQFEMDQTINKIESLLYTTEEKNVINKKVLKLEKVLNNLSEPYQIIRDIINKGDNDDKEF